MPNDTDEAMLDVTLVTMREHKREVDRLTAEKDDWRGAATEALAVAHVLDTMSRGLEDCVRERDAARAENATLRRLLTAALAQNPTWHSREAVEAVELLREDDDE